ncbi:MAG: LysR family transcriptional regulator [Pseudomonadota bacterium]
MKEIQLHKIDLNLLVVFEALMLEGSVAAAAIQLNKTPSAVSHALARLRNQLGDPLMVKVGGRMQASPFALQLIEDVRPILMSIKRVLKLPEPFDPASSTRVFRVACPITATFQTRALEAAQRSAPGIRIEWLSAPREVHGAVSEGLIDLANMGGERHLSDEFEESELPPMEFVSFVRDTHPCIKNWGPDAWTRYPHVKVAIGDEVRSPVEEVDKTAGTQRHIGALIAEFAGVAPLLASSNYIATLPPEIVAWDMERYGFQSLPPIGHTPKLRARFYWSARTAKDPTCVWLRELVMNAYRDVHAEVSALVAGRMRKEMRA